MFYGSGTTLNRPACRIRRPNGVRSTSRAHQRSHRAAVVPRTASRVNNGLVVCNSAPPAPETRLQHERRVQQPCMQDVHFLLDDASPAMVTSHQIVLTDPSDDELHSVPPNKSDTTVTTLDSTVPAELTLNETAVTTSGKLPLPPLLQQQQQQQQEHEQQLGTEWIQDKLAALLETTSATQLDALASGVSTGTLSRSAPAMQQLAQHWQPAQKSPPLQVQVAINQHADTNVAQASHSSMAGRSSMSPRSSEASVRPKAANAATAPAATAAFASRSTLGADDTPTPGSFASKGSLTRRATDATRKLLSMHTWLNVGLLALLASSALVPLLSRRGLGFSPSSIRSLGTPSGWFRASGGVPPRSLPEAAGGSTPERQGKDSMQRWDPQSKVRLISIVSEGISSPWKATYDELVEHTAQRLQWIDPSFQMLVFYEQQLAGDSAAQQRLLQALSDGCQVLVSINLQQEAAASFLADQVAKLPAVRVFYESSAALHQLEQLGSWNPASDNFFTQLLSKYVSFSPAAKAAEVYKITQDLYKRHNSDDFLFIYLVLINQFVQQVPEVAMTTKGLDLKSAICMFQHCRNQIMDCVNNPVCKKGLDCLQACSFNDQVCQYRCVVSHETPQFEKFALCVLQLHNCRGLSAEVPMVPDPAPMTSFRGQPLTHEMAEDMFIGWMQPGLDKPYSWLVAAGKNPAYDYFPCQHQLYYRGKGKGVLWYEPVFKAQLLENSPLSQGSGAPNYVWRRRRYRVKRGNTPGQFWYTVLDNGVTSNEFWRILDCAEDYAWCLFYYSGAASAAGLSYRGAVLGTPDGKFPGQQHHDKISTALGRAGIKMWELSFVDNTNCMDAPLGLPGTAASV